MFKRNDIYSFEVYPTSVLGNNYKRLRFVADLDAETARLLNFDAQAMHIKVAPQLPEGSPTDYRAYGYLKFLTEDGQPVILGSTWIRNDTIETISSEHLWVKVKAGPDKISEVTSSLVSNNFRVLEIKVGD